MGATEFKNVKIGTKFRIPTLNQEILYMKTITIFSERNEGLETLNTVIIDGYGIGTMKRIPLDFLLEHIEEEKNEN